MITASGLTKRYGAKTAVDGIDFTVHPGRVTGFLGPNGAGKSTPCAWSSDSTDRSRAPSRSYVFVVLGAIGMALLITLTMASGVGGRGEIAGATGAAETDLFVQASVFGVLLAQLIVAVLGVLVVTASTAPA